MQVQLHIYNDFCLFNCKIAVIRNKVMESFNGNLKSYDRAVFKGKFPRWLKAITSGSISE